MHVAYTEGYKQARLLLFHVNTTHYLSVVPREAGVFATPIYILRYPRVARKSLCSCFSSMCFNLSTSFQTVKHWLKLSEHILEMLALMGMLLVSFEIGILTCGHSIVSLTGRSVLHPNKYFCTKIYAHSSYNILKML